MRLPSPRFLTRQAPWLLLLLAGVFLLPLESLARGGGGENYNSGRDRGGDGDGGLPSVVIDMLLWLVIRHPTVGIPLVCVGAIGWYFYRRNLHPTGATQRAFEQREAEQRTRVSSQAVQQWVATLRQSDPQFQPQPLLDKVRWLFLALQKAWFERDLSAVRPFLSDATFQRFNVQLQLMAAQGVRDAISDYQVLDTQFLGLDQSQGFDSLHIRIRARMRDTDVPASTSDTEALEAARRAPLESFTEVWTFVRRPGTQTRVGQDLYQGKCPNCGAPFNGGAANQCEHCSAIVNSGNYDWTLSEITQGIEHVHHPAAEVKGLRELRAKDPSFNLETLEDRASLVFWKWIDAQSRDTTANLHKVAQAEALAGLDTELSSLRQQGRRKVFLECAVGGVITRGLEVHAEGVDRAHVEIRWSARMGVGPAQERPPALPTVPQRWVFTLLRKHGAQTLAEHGMSTHRCPNCHAPLTDSASATCDYCGTMLGSGEQDWVLQSALPYEAWNARSVRRAPVAAPAIPPSLSDDIIADPQERQRLLYMMASLAAADGEVDPKERKLLELCATRWSVPKDKVKLALNAGPQLFNQLLPRGSPEAEVFLRNVVEMALVDGRIDRKERRMLEFAAAHLDLTDRLQAMLERR
jgi:hypothetical protein